MRAALRLVLPAFLAALALHGGPAAAEDPPPRPWPMRHEHVPVRITMDVQLVETGEFTPR